MHSAQYTALNSATDYLVSEFSCHSMLDPRRVCALIVNYQLLSMNVRKLSRVATLWPSSYGYKYNEVATELLLIC